MQKKYRVGSSWISGEQRLLMRAALLKGNDAIQAWEKWAGNVNIDRIDIGSHRLLPLLYNNLCLHGIDHPLMNQLKGIHRHSWYKNQIMFKNIGTLMSSFEKTGIKTMVLKGAALNLLYYKNIELRPMNDFDVLVLQEQALEASSLLNKINFTSVTHLKENYFTGVHAIPFVDVSGFRVDLHWHVISTCLERDADNDFWKGAIPVKINDVSTLALNPTDELLHVCAHRGISWSPSNLWWVPDALTILYKSPEIDWKRFLFNVQKFHLILPMRETLSYLYEEFNAPMSEEMLQTIMRSRTTIGERLEHKARTTPKELRGPFLELWKHFSTYKRSRGQSQLITLLWDFPDYLRVIWNINHLWQVPFCAFYKFLQRLRRLLSWYKNKLFKFFSYPKDIKHQ